MKRCLFSILLFVLAALTATAAPVSVEKAREIALNSVKSAMMKAPGKYKQDSQQLTLALTKMPEGKVADGTAAPLFYVFNKGANGGFVVVAGDDRMRPVLGYTDDGVFSEANISPGLRWWLEAVAQVSAEVAVSRDNSPRYAPATVGAIEPLIQTKWGQGVPYNNLCPVVPETGGKTITGCVATAMAQVFYYLRYPANATGEVNYTTWTCGIEISDNLENYSFDYDAMQLEYDGTETGASADAVAKLMYACGIGMDMDYTENFSGTYLKLDYLKDRFGLDASCAFARRSMYTTEEWENIILTELSEARPVLYGGTDIEGGHQFICDGYDGEGLYHINWGWDGYFDGYFDLATLEYSGVSGMGFSMNQDIVYGLRPDTGAEDTPTVSLTCDGLTLKTSECQLGGTVAYDAFYVTAGGAPFEGSVGTGLYDADGVLVDSNTSTLIQLSTNYYYDFLSIEYILPTGLADGSYKLFFVCKPTDGELQKVPIAKGTGGATYFDVVVSGGNAVISVPSGTEPNIEKVGEAVHSGGDLYPGNTVEYTIKLKNNGDYFSKIICVGSDTRNEDEPTIFYKSNVVLEAGETKDIVVNISTLDSVATETVNVYYETLSGTRVDLGSFDVVTQEAAEGTPEISVEGISVDKQSYVKGEPVVVTATFANAGGYYEGSAIFKIYFEGHGYSTTGINFKIDKDERKEVTCSFNVSPSLEFLGITTAQCKVVAGYKDTTTDEDVYFEDVSASFSIVEETETPELTFDDLTIQTPDIEETGTLEFAATVSNAGGPYEGKLAFVIGLADGSVEYGDTTVYEDVTIATGEQTTVNVAFAIAELIERIDIEGSVSGYVKAGYTDPETGEVVLSDVSENFTVTVATGIGSIIVDGYTDEPIYTLNGVYVGKDLRKLPQGVYIIKGKKVLVK